MGRVGPLTFSWASGEDVDYGLSLSEKSQNGEDRMETDPPPNTDPEDLSKYKLDEYDNEPDKKGPYFRPTGINIFGVC
jgi:hypothetical protein